MITVSALLLLCCFVVAIHVPRREPSRRRFAAQSSQRGLARRQRQWLRGPHPWLWLCRRGSRSGRSEGSSSSQPGVQEEGEGEEEEGEGEGEEGEGEEGEGRRGRTTIITFWVVK